MSMKHKEYVLGVEAQFVQQREFKRPKPCPPGKEQKYNHYEGMGLLPGFNPVSCDDDLLQWTLDAEGHAVMRRRRELEDDVTVAQILPYIQICFEHPDAADPKDNEYFTYQRGKGVGEERLAGDWSIGVGGHIDQPDWKFDPLTKSLDLIETIAANIVRERGEELIIYDENGDEVIDTDAAGCLIEADGFIRDDSDAVGQVHLAVVLTLYLPWNWSVVCREPELITGQRGTAASILARGLKFESWSQILLEENAGVGELKNVFGQDFDSTTIAGDAAVPDIVAEQITASRDGDQERPTRWSDIPLGPPAEFPPAEPRTFEEAWIQGPHSVLEGEFKVIEGEFKNVKSVVNLAMGQALTITRPDGSSVSMTGTGYLSLNGDININQDNEAAPFMFGLIVEIPEDTPDETPSLATLASQQQSITEAVAKEIHYPAGQNVVAAGVDVATGKWLADRGYSSIVQPRENEDGSELFICTPNGNEVILTAGENESITVNRTPGELLTIVGKVITAAVSPQTKLVEVVIPTTVEDFAQQYDTSFADLQRLNPGFFRADAPYDGLQAAFDGFLIGSPSLSLEIAVWKDGEKGLRASVPFIVGVKEGDTYESIGERYGVPGDYLADLNKNYTLKVGNNIWMFEPREG